jgi:hypothetical protein
LKRPTSCKPSTSLKLSLVRRDRFGTRLARICKILQVDHTQICGFIPSKHAIDSLLKLSTAALIDANCAYLGELSRAINSMCCCTPYCCFCPFKLSLHHRHMEAIKASHKNCNFPPSVKFQFVFFIPPIFSNHLFHDFRGIYMIPVSTQGLKMEPPFSRLRTLKEPGELKIVSGSGGICLFASESSPH